MRRFRIRLNHDAARYAIRCLNWRMISKLMQCPGCDSRNGTRIDRKALITDLMRCNDCWLLYRRPQEPAQFIQRFYEDEYESSALTTQVPTPSALEDMLRLQFEGTEKDFRDKIRTFASLGLPPPARVLDYGASWGYGVWQLKNVGYQADGFELSQMRAAYGNEKLGIRTYTKSAQLPGRFYDAVFSNHVFEHFPNPRTAFDHVAAVLKPGGWLVAFFPNGSADCRRANPTRFRCNWGRLHPVYLNDDYCSTALDGRMYWMASKKYDWPLDAALLERWDRTTPWKGDMSENEMILVAQF